MLIIIISISFDYVGDNLFIDKANRITSGTRNVVENHNTIHFPSEVSRILSIQINNKITVIFKNVKKPVTLPKDTAKRFFPEKKYVITINPPI